MPLSYMLKKGEGEPAWGIRAMTVIFETRRFIELQEI